MLHVQKHLRNSLKAKTLTVIRAGQYKKTSKYINFYNVKKYLQLSHIADEKN